MSRTASRRPLLLALAAAVALLTVIGTALWIVGIARPAPQAPPATIRAAARDGATLRITAVVHGADAIDQAARTVQDVAQAIASGRYGGASPPGVVVLDVSMPDRALMRLVFDAGVLAGGAASGATPDHLLGLAGEGSRWPARSDPAARSYCDRFDTATKPFCSKVDGSPGLGAM